MMHGIYEPILRFIFNPAIREMGRNPAALFNSMFRKHLEPGEMEQNAYKVAWPLVYFRILLECDDQEVREALRLRCKALGLGSAMERAKSMVAEVEAINRASAH